MLLQISDNGSDHFALTLPSTLCVCVCEGFAIYTCRGKFLSHQVHDQSLTSFSLQDRERVDLHCNAGNSLT